VRSCFGRDVAFVCSISNKPVVESGNVESDSSLLNKCIAGYFEVSWACVVQSRQQVSAFYVPSRIKVTWSAVALAAEQLVAF